MQQVCTPPHHHHHTHTHTLLAFLPSPRVQNNGQISNSSNAIEPAPLLLGSFAGQVSALTAGGWLGGKALCAGGWGMSLTVGTQLAMVMPGTPPDADASVAPLLACPARCRSQAPPMPVSWPWCSL